MQEEASQKRREMDAKLADAQQDCEAAHKARMLSEKQLHEVRTLAVGLEKEIKEIQTDATRKEAAMVRII
jgi:hypothetical protein